MNKADGGPVAEKDWAASTWAHMMWLGLRIFGLSFLAILGGFAAIDSCTA